MIFRESFVCLFSKHRVFSFFSALDCTFTYVSAKDFSLKTVNGVETSWINLKIEFNLQGQDLPGARYYKKTSAEGPFIFAVRPDQSVWYFDDDQWYRYQTARDIRYDY
jgi:hypothetical protein